MELSRRIRSGLSSRDAVGGLADDEKLVVRREQRPDALADREVVVGYEDPCWHADSLAFQLVRTIGPWNDFGRRVVSRFPTRSRERRQLGRSLGGCSYLMAQ
jgi:hypothetical protein